MRGAQLLNNISSLRTYSRYISNLRTYSDTYVILYSIFHCTTPSAEHTVSRYIFEPVLNACNTDAPRVAYISFPPPAASTVCSNQPVTNFLVIWELCLDSSTAVKETVPSLILFCVPNQKVISVFQKVFSHLSYNAARLTALLDIVHGVSLFPCDGVLQLQ